jgi:hypothetical protein
MKNFKKTNILVRPVYWLPGLQMPSEAATSPRDLPRGWRHEKICEREGVCVRVCVRACVCM